MIFYKSLLAPHQDLIKKQKQDTVIYFKKKFSGIVERLDYLPLEDLPSSSNTRVAKIKGAPFFVKYFLYNHWRHILKSPFTASKSEKAYTGAILFLKAGLNTPLPVVFGETRTKLGIIKSAFFITHDIDAESLISIIEPDKLSGSRLLSFASALGKDIGKMHKVGIYHGDLTLYNIFTDRIFLEEHDEKPRFIYLDVEGYIHTKHALPEKLVLGDLKSLNNLRQIKITARHKVMFLKSYLSENNILKDKNHRRRFLGRLAYMSRKRWL